MMNLTSLATRIANRASLIAFVLLTLVGFSTAQSTKDALDSHGIVTTTAKQPDAPAFLREATFGIVANECSSPSHCIALQRIVLKNKNAAPIKSYRLGWVVVSADPKKAAEVHVGNAVALYQVIGPHQEREFVENLAPLVQMGPTVRMIAYFVAEVQWQDASLFTQDVNRLASDQYEQFWTHSKRD